MRPKSAQRTHPSLLTILILIASATCRTAQGDNVPAITALDVPEPLTLEAAYALALEHNPRLKTFAWDIRAADARIVQSSLRPNPELSFELEDFRINDGPRERVQSTTIGLGGVDLTQEQANAGPRGFAESELTLTLSQRFELGGKRSTRIDVAHGEKAVAEWDCEMARADVLSHVARAYVDVLAKQYALELREELLKLAQHVADDIGIAVQAGKLSPVEETRALSEASNAQLDLLQTGHALRGAKAALASTWGVPTMEIGRVAGDLDELPPLPPRDSLLALADHSPEIARWIRETSRREAIVQHERARRIPDLTVSLGIRSTGIEGRNAHGYGWTGGGPFYSWTDSDFDTNRDTSVVLGMSLPLPLFDRNQGNIAEAELFASKAYDQRQADLAEVQADLVIWYERAQAAFEEAKQLDEVALPRAQRIFGAIREGHDAGKFRSLDLLDAERTVTFERVRRAEALAGYHVARIEIERIIGQAIEGLEEIEDASSTDDREETLPCNQAQRGPDARRRSARGTLPRGRFDSGTRGAALRGRSR